MFDESPFANFTTPESLRPITDQFYVLPDYLAVKLNKQQDEVIYFCGSLIAISCCFALKSIQGETAKKIFSITAVMGI